VVPTTDAADNHYEYVAYILSFVDHASRYIRVMKTNLVHCLSSVYFVNQPLHFFSISCYRASYNDK